MNIYDVFLSYRRSDGAELAQKIFDYLTAKGLRVFFDTEKMIDGHYFTTQIVDNLRQTPNYILVATQDVFNFRDGEDWVCEEIALALTEYEADSINRTVNVIAPSGVVFPDQSVLPKSVRNITVPNRINLSDSEPTDEEYLRLLKAVSGVNRRNLWNAGHRWLENSKKEGARFAALRIDETIMPKAKKRAKKQEHGEMPIRVYQKEKSEDGYEHRTDEQQLLDALGYTQGHLYLIGEGGIGKTTSLIRIMNEAYSGRKYSENAQIPLFIELSRAPDTYGRLYEGGTSTFIRRAIYQQIRADRSVKQVSAQASRQIDNVFSTAPELAVIPVNDLLTAESSAPEYFLLLDGLNETSRTEIEEVGRSVVEMIMQEINWIIENCPNVRIMLTSRTDETAMSNKEITRLYLTGVDNDTIRGYLESCKLPRKRIDAVFENERLLETLRIPLFLTMYASLKGANEVTSRGGIFRMFFSERRENLDVYTTQSRIESVEADIASAASKHNATRIDAKIQNFILDFLLPEIAWNMERKGLFYMDIEDIADIIERGLTDESLTAVCGRYGKKLFTKYRNGADSAMHTLRVAKSMINKLGGDFEEIAEAVVNCCTLQLGIMQESNGQYGFMHHHIRDYFAAVREVNSLRLAVYIFEQGNDKVARECLVSMKETPIHLEVRRFIGEYLSEDKNAPILVDGKWKYNVPTEKCDRNLIKRAIDIFRGRFDGEDGYVVYCLIEVLKNVRKDMSGTDLSRLDLTQCTLNGVDLSEHGSSATFHGAKIFRKSLFPVGHSDSITCVSYSPNGTRIITASADKTAKVWDATTGSLVMTLGGHSDSVSDVAYSPDGTHIITACVDGTAIIWNASTGTIVNKLGEKTICSQIRFLHCVAYSPDGRYIVTAARHAVIVWDATTAEKILSFEGHEYEIESVNFSPDGTRIVTSSLDTPLIIWDAATGAQITNIKRPELGSCAKYNSDGTRIATLSSEDICILDAATGELMMQFEGKPLDMSFSPDGRYIAIAAYDEPISIWNAATYEMEKTIGPIGESSLIEYSPDGRNIVSASEIGIKIWDIGSGNLLIDITGRPNKINSVSYSKDNSNILISSADGTSKIWDVATVMPIMTLDGHSDNVNTSFYSPDNKSIAMASSDGTVKIWNATTGTIKYTFADYSSTVLCASYNHNGNNIATVSDKVVRILDVSNGALIRTIDIGCDSSSDASGKTVEFGNKVGCEQDVSREALMDVIGIALEESIRDVSIISYNPTDNCIAFAYEKTAKICDAYTGELLFTLTGHTHKVNSVVYNPDGDHIVTASDDYTAIVWNAANGTRKLTLNGHNSSVEYATYSLDGNYIITVSNDTTAKVWDATYGTLLTTLEGHSSRVNSATYNSDGRYIITASFDGTFRVWDTKTYECIDIIENVPGLRIIGCDLRNLHPDSNFSDEDKEILRRYGAIID